jgi:NAD(P)-dependent dehydrogenase (short-subunit alcohol dehydrogenase family)
MEVKGTVVLITGASSGIGAAAALAFDRAGARVAVAARRAERLEKLVERMADALAVPTDLTDPAATAAMVDSTVRRFGGIDVLINNAAIIAMAPGDRTRPDDVRRCLETNFIGPMVATNQAVKHMRRRGGGHIINIGSPAAVLGVPFLGPYTASKAAMSGWTRSLQAEWEGTGIVVSEYLPGNVATGAQAESELGVIGGDVFEDPNQHPLTRALARPQRAEKIAADLVDLVRRPRPVMYSSPGVRLGLWLTIFSPLRRALGTKMATAVRRRLGLSVFSDRVPAADTAAKDEAKARSATNGKRKGAGRKTKSADSGTKTGASTTRSTHASRKESAAKPRRRKASQTPNDDRPV